MQGSEPRRVHLALRCELCAVIYRLGSEPFCCYVRGSEPKIGIHAIPLILRVGGLIISLFSGVFQKIVDNEERLKKIHCRCRIGMLWCTAVFAGRLAQFG